MSGLSIHHKQNFHVIRWVVSLLLLAAIMLYAYFGVRWYNTGELSPLPLPVAAADATIDETPVTDKLVQAHTVAADEPRYIQIPRLNISQTRVTEVGVTDRNMLDVPKNIDDSAWYAKSAKPGSGVGAVVIDGHNGGVSRDGTFANLGTLRKDDQISVERGDGKVLTYEVHDVRDMPLDWVNNVGMKEMMYSIDPSKEGLNLITCSGKWIPKDKVYDRRVLVRATLVE
ncbi:class F sortase [Candidatus Saccharibacteria bacterium]|nr:class F sortase [Candidatus Saccharibacteria bacterium]